MLVHGLGMSHRYLARLHRELASWGDTHSVDLPGFGGTPAPGAVMSVARGAALLGGALDALGVTAAVVIGHSMGAQFATELAVHRPELVSHLVLVGPVTDPDRARPLVQALDLTRDALKEPPSGNLLTATDYVRCGPRWYFTELVPMLAYRTDERLASVAAPTLVIRGTEDPVARRAWSAELARRAPSGTLVEIPGHRHLVQHTAAAATAAAVIARVRPTAPTTAGR
ncbi:alpha/beta fold hydrolase [Cellulomonas rhizosphaerae]|uniref:Alpha/beta fold hydrolase n=1 Tax=Cellulomonas rhizosphaerae TaxID=2293719 RepID=A0A413RQ65_9CELL|nr:alpha/beta fold hydrolase [Cellulomonas rhizosphaerae]RHA44097.1 alpha/beta fold hydrolase [Cellulomonas rhizosphaerae]